MQYPKTGNIIANSKKLKTFLLRLGTRYKCPLLSFLFNIELEVLGRTLRQGKENKGDLHQEGRIKLSLFTDDMISYIDNPKDATKNLSELI